MAQLSDLPKDLIEIILEYPTDVVDLYNYRHVCRSWRSIVDKLLASSPPHLLLYEMENNIRLLNIFTGDSSVYKIPDFKTRGGKPLRFPRSVFSQHGWLAINFTTRKKQRYTHHFFLYNPLSRARIRLPTCTFDRHFQNISEPEMRFVLSSKQTTSLPPSSVALAIGKNIMLWKPGDEDWTPIDSPLKNNMLVFDIISYKGRLCAIDFLGNVAEFDQFNPVPDPDETGNGIEMLFLLSSSSICVVESLSGDLLTVCRCREGFFNVFKLDWETMVWGEITSLGDEAIFMAGKESVCVRASDSTVYKRNCVYFKDEQLPSDMPERSREDFGVYDMANKTIHRFSHPFPRRFVPYQWLTTQI
jgi:hypothetical protein